MLTCVRVKIYLQAGAVSSFALSVANVNAGCSSTFVTVTVKSCVTVVPPSSVALKWIYLVKSAIVYIFYIMVLQK